MRACGRCGFMVMDRDTAICNPDGSVHVCPSPGQGVSLAELDWDRLRSGNARALDPSHQEVFDYVMLLKRQRDEALAELELAEAERSSAAEAAGYLMEALKVGGGGLASMTLELIKQRDEARERLERCVTASHTAPEPGVWCPVAPRVEQRCGACGLTHVWHFRIRDGMVEVALVNAGDTMRLTQLAEELDAAQGHARLAAELDAERARLITRIQQLASLLREYVEPASEMWQWKRHADWILRVNEALGEGRERENA